MATEKHKGTLNTKKSSMTFKAQSILYGHPSIYPTLLSVDNGSFTYLVSPGLICAIYPIETGA
jgi:hypothetical protein